MPVSTCRTHGKERAATFAAKGIRFIRMDTPCRMQIPQWIPAKEAESTLIAFDMQAGTAVYFKVK